LVVVDLAWMRVRVKFINQFNAAGTAKPRSVIAFSTASIDLLSEFRSRRKPLWHRHSPDAETVLQEGPPRRRPSDRAFCRVFLKKEKRCGRGTRKTLKDTRQM